MLARLQEVWQGRTSRLFAEILPDYDSDRVHDSDIKKLLQWYNILVSNGVTNFVDPEENAEEATEEAAEKAE